MKKQLFFLFLLVSSYGISQTTWNALPQVPANPSAGSVAANAGDVIITDDSRIYTAYMWDNGSGWKLYFDEYIQGTGWVNFHNETIYNGAQEIRSRKTGNTAYFVTMTGNAAGAPLCKVFTVNQGSAYQYSSFSLTDFQQAAGFDFEMGADINQGYILYKNNAGSGLYLGRLNYSGNYVSNAFVSISGLTALDHYDMTIAGDSIFIAISAQAPSYKLLLLKAGPMGDVIVPYNGSTTDGQVFNGGNPITTHDFMINSDGISKVFLQGYDPGNMSGIEKVYENGTLSLQTYYGHIAENYSNGMTVGTANTLFYLNNYSPSNAAPYSTYVMTRDVASNTADTIGAPSGFLLAGNSPSEHRMGFADTKKRAVASFFNPSSTTREFYLSNDAPYISTTNIDLSSPMCVLQSSTIFDNIGITDDNGDPVTILNIQSSNSAVLNAGNINFSYSSTIGNVMNYYFYGTADQTGTTIITLEVTDGWDTVLLQLPQISVAAPNPPVYNVAQVDLCDGMGDVNLFDYVSSTGGYFYINSLEMTFPNNVFPTNNSPLSPGSSYLLSYDLFDGACNHTIDVPIMFNSSPSVTIVPTATACGQANGVAIATITGGGMPYQFSQWSSGEQNVTSVSNLSAGQYSYSLTDANNCLVTKYFEIAAAGANATAAVSNVLCHGQANGAIDITTSGLVAPITALWSSGHSTIDLAGVPVGTYSVTLSDAGGCTITQTFTITEPDPLVSNTSMTLPNCQQVNGSIAIDQTTGGTGAYSYSWSNGDTGPMADNLPFGIHTLTTTDGNSCVTTNTIYLSELGGADLYGTVTPTNCGSNDGAIDVYVSLPFNVAVSSIQWSNSATTEDIANLVPGNYICILTANNNCRAVRGWNVPSVAPERNDICVVTVDSATTTNLVVWEKVQTSGIDHYNIYRETATQGEFVLIDTVQATNISLFNDVVASPTVRSWRYKISAVNGCGLEGPLSPAHQTIHLDVLDNGGTDVTINWNPYIGAAFSNYLVSRYTDANGWELIATLPTTQLSYNDATPFVTPGLDYMVEIELDDTCTALVWRSQDFNSSRSNKEKGQFAAGDGTGDSNNGIEEGYLSTIRVSPNPTNDLLNIVQEEPKPLVIEVRAVDGQLLQTVHSSLLDQQIDLGSYADGIYFVTLGMNHVRQTLRIVKQ